MQQYIEKIVKLLNNLNEEDFPVVQQIYTILSKYLQKRGRR